MFWQDPGLRYNAIVFDSTQNTKFQLEIPDEWSPGTYTIAAVTDLNSVMIGFTNQQWVEESINQSAIMINSGSEEFLPAPSLFTYLISIISAAFAQRKKIKN